MRSKSTNFLQVIILLTGILYFSAGLIFFISPVLFVSLFSIEISDGWSKGMQLDTFMAILFFLSRAFAAMVICSGMAMILPLYDPLKYRGLIYYTGILFPILSSMLLIINGIKLDYLLITLIGLTFFAVFLLTAAGLIITRNEAKAGIE